MLDHEERFLFREEIHNLANALADPGQLDNVEDLLAEVTTSPRFDADVFTLERSLQVMLGGRAGSTLVGLLTVDREVFDEIGDIDASVQNKLLRVLLGLLPPASLDRLFLMFALAFWVLAVPLTLLFFDNLHVHASGEPGATEKISHFLRNTTLHEPS